MRIIQDKCVACLECIDYCPVEAIKEDPAKGRVAAKVADGTVRDGGVRWKEGLIHSTLWVSWEG